MYCHHNNTCLTDHLLMLNALCYSRFSNSSWTDDSGDGDLHKWNLQWQITLWWWGQVSGSGSVFQSQKRVYIFQMSFIALSSHPHPSPLVLTATSRTAVIAVLQSDSMAGQLSIPIVTPWKAMPADMIPYRWQVKLYIMIIDHLSQRRNRKSSHYYIFRATMFY